MPDRTPFPSLGSLRHVTSSKTIRFATVGAACLPSLLQCDFGNLAKEVDALESANVKALHLDVMDGHFVPNLTYGMPIVVGLRALTDLPLDVHLMIENPEQYIEQFVDAGADVITIHVETVENPQSVLAEIRNFGVAAGLALNPDTALETVLPHLEACDLVLVMSVNAGFGGQDFNPVAIEKLATLKSQKPDHVLLEVDGGVNSHTIATCAEAGADLLVVGSAIFKQENYQIAIDQLHSLLA